jgi:hypothetical protein
LCLLSPADRSSHQRFVDGTEQKQAMGSLELAKMIGRFAKLKEFPSRELSCKSIQRGEQESAALNAQA